MFKKEIGGKIYYCFEESDRVIQQQLEENTMAVEMSNSLIESLINALVKKRLKEQKIWQELKKTVQEMGEYIPPNGIYCYDWEVQGFYYIKQDS